MTNKKFNEFLIKEKIVGFKEEGFTLKSGKTSYWYANCRSLAKNLKSLETTADFVVKFLKDNKIINKSIDAVLGVPEGATLHGGKVSEKLIKSRLIKDQIYSLRVKEKTHGDPANRFWTNGNIPKKVILLEDVTTTGGSVLALAQKLTEMGIKIHAVVGLINRCQLDEQNKSVVQKMKEQRLKYYSLTNATSVLPQAASTLSAKARQNIITKVQGEYIAEYGDIKKIPVTF